MSFPPAAAWSAWSSPFMAATTDRSRDAQISVVVIKLGGHAMGSDEAMALGMAVSALPPPHHVHYVLCRLFTLRTECNVKGPLFA